VQILNTLDLSGAPEAIKRLEQVGQLTSAAPDRAIVLELLPKFDAYLCSASVVVDVEFLDRAPRLKVIGSPSTGTDHLDLTAIRQRGIECFDISKEFDLINSFTATSELAFGLLLALNRKLINAKMDAERGIWAREKYSGFQLRGKVLGIIGLGRLGKISAKIAQGFGMSVIACDSDPKAEFHGVTMVSLESLLRNADVVSLHVHLTSETESLIGLEQFKMMKPSSILINTSRGKIVNEAALLDALESDKIAGAALDVVDGEWLSEQDLARHPLIQFSAKSDKLIVVPHIGGSTFESIYGARVFMANKIATWVEEHAS